MGSTVVFLAIFIYLALLSAPYIYAWQAAPAGWNFNGFLINPQDGNSYLAKMYLGWMGEWKFRLPFTSESGGGGYLFLLYIFLGHLARSLHLNLTLVYHAARIAGSAYLALVTVRFFERVLPYERDGGLPIILALFGGGLGWLAVPFGGFTSDFWVAEAYPFLSGLANPHFPISLGLMVSLITPPIQKDTPQDWGRRFGYWSLVFLKAILLSLLSPFGLVIVSLVLGAYGLWAYFYKHLGGLARASLQNTLVTILAGAPYGLYLMGLLTRDPYLSQWNSQNLTPAPPLWDVLLALSPALIFALFSYRKAFKGRLALISLWVLIGFTLLFLPTSLQRRFMVGLFIPLAGLAAVGVRTIAGRFGRTRVFSAVLLLLSLPTNVLVLMAVRQGVSRADPQYYMSDAEVAAYQWIASETEPGDVFITSPATGLLLPGRTGRRVVYGHPYETVQAAERQEAVEGFFAEPQSKKSQTLLNEAEYVYVGPKERLLGDFEPGSWLRKAYENQEVTIYKIITQNEDS